MNPRHQTVLIAIAIVIGAVCGGVLNDRVTDLPLSNPLALLAYRYPPLSGQDGMLASIGMAGVPFAAALASIALLLSAWKLDHPWRATPVLVGAVLLFVWCAVSALAEGSIHAGLTMLTVLACASSIGAVVSILSGRLELRRAILFTLIGTATLISSIGLGEYVSSAVQKNYSWRVFGTFTDPNFLAGFLVMTVPPTVAAFLTIRSRNGAILTGVALAMEAACLMLTGSRFGLVSLVSELVLLAVLVWRIGLSGPARSRARLLAGICVVAVLVGAWPVLRRLARVGSEAHSNQFRLYTWKGAAALASAKPMLGSGFGTFDVASPPYSQVSYTQHAHNSFLQVAAETGIPGVLLLLILLGAVLARVTTALSPTEESEPAEEIPAEPVKTGRRRARKQPTTPPKVALAETDAERRIIVASIAAALAGAVLRNLFDSDLYVPANAIAFACICGLALGIRSVNLDSQAEVYALANGVGETPLPVPMPVRRTILTAIAILLVVRSASVIVGRNAFLTADILAPTGHLADAVNSYSAAAAGDFGNPDCPLRSAPLLDALGRPDDAERSYKAAIQLTKSAIPQYRYGRFLLKRNRTDEAIATLEASRTRNPNSLPALLVLAETYNNSGHQAQAKSIYRKIVELHQSPFGQVRATPEIVEWRFGAAYAELAEIIATRGSTEEADRLLEAGNAIFAEYWGRRAANMFSPEYRPEALKDVVGRYIHAIDQRAAILGRLRRLDEAAAQDQLGKEVRAQLQSLESASPAS